MLAVDAAAGFGLAASASASAQPLITAVITLPPRLCPAIDNCSYYTPESASASAYAFSLLFPIHIAYFTWFSVTQKLPVAFNCLALVGPTRFYLGALDFT